MKLETIVSVKTVCEVERGQEDFVSNEVELEAHRLSMKELYKDFADKVNAEMDVDPADCTVDVLVTARVVNERDFSHIDDRLIGKDVYCVFRPTADCEQLYLHRAMVLVGFTEDGILARDEDGNCDYVQNGHWFLDEDEAADVAKTLDESAKRSV